MSKWDSTVHDRTLRPPPTTDSSLIREMAAMVHLGGLRALPLRPRTRLPDSTAAGRSRSAVCCCGGRGGASIARVFSSQSAADRVHIPVLLHETVAFWRGDASSSSRSSSGERFFVDGTAGFGGHSRALLEREPSARLLCVDRDPEVLAVARRNLEGFGPRVAFRRGSYAQVRAHLAAAGFPEQVDGALVDLGANSFHLDEARRGFSFMGDGPLDMRFDQSGDAPTAADVVNGESEVALTKIFKVYGEERLAKEYAKAIVREREQHGRAFRSTHDLRECIERIARKWGVWGNGRRRGGATHPATRCFQALRIHVNDELGHVEVGGGVRAPWWHRSW